ncbi:MAG: hypothetical protein JWO82_600 [Akkermansiaceae bacterium]|nr:hypothetical protein [Akkermansiaceae bacterium]
MKNLAKLLLLSVAAGTAVADVPKKPPVNQYNLLWTRSPFTTKPTPPPPTDPVSPFEDWALGGVSEISGGYMVTLINVKKQGEMQVVRPDRVEVVTPDTVEFFNPGEGGNFSVVRVDFGKESWKDTKVILAAGGKTGSVEFKEDLMIPKSGAAAPQPVPGQPPGAVPPQPQGQGQAAPAPAAPGGRVPRPRGAVPTPAPARR